MMDISARTGDAESIQDEIRSVAPPARICLPACTCNRCTRTMLVLAACPKPSPPRRPEPHRRPAPSLYICAPIPGKSSATIASPALNGYGDSICRDLPRLSRPSSSSMRAPALRAERCDILSIAEISPASCVYRSETWDAESDRTSVGSGAVAHLSVDDGDLATVDPPPPRKTVSISRVLSSTFFACPPATWSILGEGRYSAQSNDIVLGFNTIFPDYLDQNENAHGDISPSSWEIQWGFGDILRFPPWRRL